MVTDRVTVKGGAVLILATFAICCLAFLSGLLFTWPSYNVANFVSNGTVLSEPMTSIHVSLLGSLMNFGTIFMTPVMGTVTNRIGRKYTLMGIGLFFVIAWTIVSLTNSVPLILVAVTIGGCGTSGQAICAIYLSEIAHESVRGAMSSSIQAIYFVGVLISYIIGGNLKYSQVIYLVLTISILNIVLISMLKDSPIYLLQNGREKEAVESIAFYRQRIPNSIQVQNEITRLKAQLNVGMDKPIEEEDGPMVTKKFLPTPDPQKLTEWQFLKKSSSSKKAFITSLIIMAVMILMGNIPIQVYAETLFKEATPSFDANTCSVWLGIDFLVATLSCMVTVDKLGRKTLTIFSCVTSAICTLILGTQMQFRWASEWFTIILLFVYNFVFNMGIAVMPYVLVGEIFLPEIRSICSSYTVSIGFVLNFIVTLVFNPIIDSFGFATLFYGFSVVGFVGAVFVLYYLPETKGLTVDVIQGLFLSKIKNEQVIY